MTSKQVEGPWLERPIGQLAKMFIYYRARGFSIYPRMLCRTCNEVHTMPTPADKFPLFADCPSCGESHGFLFHGGNMAVRKDYNSESEQTAEFADICREFDANPSDWK